MGLTITNFQTTVSGSKRRNIMDVTFDSSYATGGEALTPAQMGLIAVDRVQASETGGRSFPYDLTNQKLLAYASTTQVTNGTDLSAVTTRIEAVGI